MAEGLTTAGDFVLDLAEIITVDGSPVKVTANVLSVILFEDIENPFISGSISFNDGLNIQNLLPLIGQEVLKLRLRTPSFETEEMIIDSLFYINNLSTVLDVNTNNKILNFEFISIEAMENSRKSVSRTLRGTCASIVETLLRNDLKCSKDFFVDPTKDGRIILGTDVSPMKIIRDMTNEAISERHGSPTYMFFETLEGFHFRSLESLYKEKILMEYTSDGTGGHTPRKHGFSEVILELNKIRKVQKTNTNDSMADQKSGSYASTVITHDIFNKTYKESNYNYFESFKDERHINFFNGRGKQEPMIAKVALDDNGSTISDLPVKTFLLPVSFADIVSKQDGQYTNAITNDYKNIRGYDPDSFITKRTSMLNNYDAIAADIEVDGNTFIRAGNMVELNLPAQSAERMEEPDKVDRFYRGAFLIRNIKHSFTLSENENKHVMSLSCVSDCVDKEILGSEIDIVPKVYGKSKKINPLTINVNRLSDTNY